MDETKILDWFRSHLFLKYGIREELVAPPAKLVTDLALDSLDLMSFMFAVEEEFGLEIFMNDEDDYGEIRTVADAIGYILRELNNG